MIICMHYITTPTDIYLISRKESRQTEHPLLFPTGLMLVVVADGEVVRSISTTLLGVWVASSMLSSTTEASEVSPLS